MKKQYVFLIMILIILYILYLILNKSYYEYKINSHIEAINSINNVIKEKIKTAKEIIEYKSSKAYKNKILKEQQSFKNK
jgi:cell shape-determining protein MreC